MTTTTRSTLDDALEGLRQALAAMGAGDPAPYAALWLRSDDVTLYGAWGPAERGHGSVTSTDDLRTATPGEPTAGPVAS